MFEPESDDNLALVLAREIKGRLPIIYAGYERLDAVATRFKGQICENAECLAFTNIFPEFNHNELVGWGKLYDLEEKLIVLILKDQQDHPRVHARMDIVSEYLEGKRIRVRTIESVGDSDLERMFSLVQLADFTSYYLALLNEVDPSPVAIIDHLKSRLAEIEVK